MGFGTGVGTEMLKLPSAVKHPEVQRHPTSIHRSVPPRTTRLHSKLHERRPSRSMVNRMRSARICRHSIKLPEWEILEPIPKRSDFVGGSWEVYERRKGERTRPFNMARQQGMQWIQTVESSQAKRTQLVRCMLAVYTRLIIFRSR